MANYTHNYSNFPSSIINMPTFKDIDIDILPKIKEFNTAIENGDFKLAINLFNTYNLGDYSVDAEKIETIIEEVRNTQIYAKTKGQQIIYVDSTKDFPDNPVDGDVYRVLKK